MHIPAVSVVIPCYNVEQFVGECLDSVLTQTLSEIEVICVNDGSTDGTLQILQQYRQKDSRVILIDQENQGVAASRNTAIRKASGEYVIFMDPDDFYPASDTLALLYTKAADHHARICGGSMSVFEQESGEINTHFPGDLAGNTFTQEGFMDYRDYQFDFGYHRFLFDRKFLLENNLFFPPYKRSQDPPFFVRAMITAGSFYAVPDVVYRYRWGSQAPFTSWSREKICDLMRSRLDNLNISAEYGLCHLHALTVRRIDIHSASKLITQALHSGDTEVLALLVKLNQAVRPALLVEAGMELNTKDGYILLPFVQMLHSFFHTSRVADLEKAHLQNERVIGQLRKELSSVKGSASYRIGRIITYIPRKLRGVLRCCKEHSIGYAAKLSFARIFRKNK